MSRKKDKLVIFDLDETLIHSMIEPLDRPPDLVVEPLSVYVRPYARELINLFAEKFSFAIWSAGSPLYVEAIAEFLLDKDLKPVFIWDREMCSEKGSVFSFQKFLTKDLNRMKEFGFDLSSTLIIEDDPIKISKFKNNAIIVRQYFGDNNDRELIQLADYIGDIDTVDDIRKLDKNLWNFKG